MGQDLRVAAWLHFGNKAQLTKGLRAFAQHAASEFFDADTWELCELEATLRLDVELPGDFTDVERSFIEIIRAAAFGYVDYFERDNDKIHAGRGPRGPLKRWVLGAIPQKIILPYGTTGLDWAGKDEELVVEGSFRYADEATPKRLIQSGFRFPYLLERGARELRLGPDCFAIDGSKLSLSLVVTGPAAALEDPLVELLRLLGTKATSGSMALQAGRSQMQVGPKGKLRSSYVAKAIRASEGARRVGTVEANAPLAPPVASEEQRAASEAKGEGSAPGKRGGKAKKSADAGVEALPAEAGPVAGAKLLSGDRLLLWGARNATLLALSDRRVLQRFSTALEDDATFGWPVLGATELPGDRVVIFHEMNGDLDWLDLATGARTIKKAHGHSVYGATVVGERLLCWSLDGTARSFTFDGELDRVFAATGPEGGFDRVDRVLVLEDGSFITVAGQKALRFDLATGEVRERYGERTDAHALSGGRFLLEHYGVFELFGGAREGLCFTIDQGNNHVVLPLGEDEILVPVRRSLEIVSLVDGSMRSVPTGHSKDLGAVVPVGEGLWVSHARSMPALNERFGFDGTLRVWSEGTWEAKSSHDFKAPIRALVALPGQRAAVLLDDAVKGKELAIYGAASGRMVTTIKGAKKPVVGALPLPSGGLFTWSKDGVGRFVLG